MVIIPSRISISAARIYLQPLVNISSAPVFKFKISAIARALHRRHMHEESALEIFFEPSVDARIFSSQVSAGKKARENVTLHAMSATTNGRYSRSYSACLDPPPATACS